MKYILFGAGNVAEMVYNQLKNKGDELIGVVDNFSFKNRKIKMFKDFEVKSPAKFTNKFNNDIYIYIYILPLIRFM